MIVNAAVFLLLLLVLVLVLLLLLVRRELLRRELVLVLVLVLLLVLVLQFLVLVQLPCCSVVVVVVLVLVLVLLLQRHAGTQRAPLSSPRDQVHQSASTVPARSARTAACSQHTPRAVRTPPPFEKFKRWLAFSPRKIAGSNPGDLFKKSNKFFQ